MRRTPVAAHGAVCLARAAPRPPRGGARAPHPALDSRSDTSSPEAVALIIHLAVGSLYRLDFAGMREWSERAVDGRGVARRSAPDSGRHVGAGGGRCVHRTRAGRRGSRLGGRGPGGRPLRSGTRAPPRRAREPVHRGAVPPPIPRGRRARPARARRGPGRRAREASRPSSSPCWPTSSICGDAWPSPPTSSTRPSTRPGSRATWRQLGWNLLGRSFTALAAGDVTLALSTAEEAVDLTRSLDDSLVSTNAGVALAHAHYESGEPRRGRDAPDGRGRG